MNRLYGVVCATITPMDSEGEIDLDSARSLYRYLAQTGIHCLYPNGTNGESVSLTTEERNALAEAAVQEVGGRMPVYIQCGAATARESYRHVLHARSIGADGAGLMTPVFFPLDEAAMEQYYSQILAKTQGFPLYVYNIPLRTGNDISPRTLGRLMDAHPSLMGIKYSMPDLLRIQSYIHCAKSRNADVLIGCDSLAYCCMACGGVGWVSGPGAVFAKPFVRLYSQISQKDMPAAGQTQETITRIMNRMAGIPEIPAIKYMLRRMGIIRYDTVRSPLRPLTEDEKLVLDGLLEETPL